jgi:hypothetical protein
MCQKVHVICHDIYGTQFAEMAGVEGDLTGAVLDLIRSSRHAFALDRIDLHHRYGLDAVEAQSGNSAEDQGNKDIGKRRPRRYLPSAADRPRLSQDPSTSRSGKMSIGFSWSGENILLLAFIIWSPDERSRR